MHACSREHLESCAHDRRLSGVMNFSLQEYDDVFKLSRRCFIPPNFAGVSMWLLLFLLEQTYALINITWRFPSVSLAAELRHIVNIAQIHAVSVKLTYQHNFM